MAVKQRARAKLFCVVVCLASALLCALNRAPVLAVVHIVAALVIWRVRFGMPLESTDVVVLIATLRDARNAEEASPTMIRATVMPNVIAVPSSPMRWHQTAIAFRDEMVADQWRQIATSLRHQPRADASLTLLKKISRP